MVVAVVVRRQGVGLGVVMHGQIVGFGQVVEVVVAVRHSQVVGFDVGFGRQVVAAAVVVRLGDRVDSHQVVGSAVGSDQARWPRLLIVKSPGRYYLYLKR